MRLPEYQRVVFRKPPLALTLAQVRFTPRFRIEDPPRLAAFQESIEGHYPRFEREAQMGVIVSSKGLQAQPGQELLRFSSQDQRTSVVLAPDALTLEIRQFGTIDDLQTAFQRALDPLIEHFHPPSQQRIGMRFVNEFRHPKGDTPIGWKSLLNEELVGLAGNPVFSDSVQECAQQLLLKEDSYTVILRHGFFPKGSTVPAPAKSEIADGPFYLLDLDCFREEQAPLEVDAALARLRDFNDVLYRIFRWSLRDELFELFEPIEK